MSQYEFDKTLVFVTFAGEEEGLLGASLYAAKAKKENQNIEALLNNDIIGSDVVKVDSAHVSKLAAAFAEAAVIGALADWFAVVALFRHPLGLKLPHTSILRRNKDRIADNLGAFIQDKFLATGRIVAAIAAFDRFLETSRNIYAVAFAELADQPFHSLWTLLKALPDMARLGGYKTVFPEVYHVPKLGGQSAAYLTAALNAYKNGQRSHPSMKGVAAGLSDKDIADLAAYYAGARR